MVKQYRLLYKTPHRKRYTYYGYEGSKKEVTKKLALEKKKFPAIRNKRYWKFKIIK